MFKKSLLSYAVLFSLTYLTACSTDDKIKFTADDFQFSQLDVLENDAGALVGNIELSNTQDTVIDSITTNDERFIVENNQLKLASGISLNFEQTPVETIELAVNFDGNGSYIREITIEVTDVLDTYTFSGVGSDSSSVSYSGQVARHLLILELNNYIASTLQSDLDNGVLTSHDEVFEKLMSFYKADDEAYDLDLGERTLNTGTSPDRKQNTLKDVSSSTKDLSAKMAGNDATGQYKDWSTEFISFGEQGSYSPESLIEAMFSELADNAVEYLQGNLRQNLLNQEISKVYITPDGRDLKQLIQKVILGALAYSQGTDDYLDNDIDGKGLNADNTALVDGKTYTNLEHQFDEGFGYFGAARDYLEYSLEEISVKGGRENWQGMYDSNADGLIDFNSEYNFGHSANAAKRDLGTVSNSNPTSFRTDAMMAFLNARQIIADAQATELSEDARTQLLAQRDIAVANWEKAIAATVVHYINDVTADYADFATDDFSFTNLAKHWSEMKGFFISLQFNPRSLLSTADFNRINNFFADAPALNDESIDSYLADLASAKAIIAVSYDFDAENVSNW